LLAVVGALPAGAGTQPPARLGLGAYSGKVVYVDFWASWCAPCRDSFAWMNEMQAKYGDEGLVIIAVNVDADRNAAARFLQAHPADFRLLYDHDDELARYYDLPGMPSSFIYGRDGLLRDRHVGFREKDEAQLEALITDLLKEAP